MPSSKKEQTPKNTDSVWYSIEQSINSTTKTINKYGKGIFYQMIKVGVITTIITMVSIGILAVVFFSLFGTDLETITYNVKNASLTTWIIVSIVAIIDIAIARFLMSTFNSTGFNIIDYSIAGKDANITEYAKKNFIPVTGYTLFVFLASIIIYSPAIVLFVLGFGSMLGAVGTAGSENAIKIIMGSISALMSAIVFYIIGILIYLIFFFFIQFALLELVVSRRKVIESLKESAKTVRANIVNVFIYDIMLVIGGAVIGGIFYILQEALGELIRGTMSLFMSGDTSLAIIIGIITMIFAFVLGIVQFAATATLIWPFQYFYWKTIK